MIIFDVVKEPYGWAVRCEDGMMTPVWCRAMAIEQAQRMVDTLIRHGQSAMLRIGDDDFGEEPESIIRQKRPAIAATKTMSHVQKHVFQGDPR